MIQALGERNRGSKYDAGLATRLNEELEREKRARKDRSTPEPFQASRNQSASPSPQVDNQNLPFPEYVQIPFTDIEIATRISLQGQDWFTTHYSLSEQGLFMPTLSLWRKYIDHIRNWVNNNGTASKISHYEHNWIPRETAQELEAYLLKGRFGAYETWIDMYFESNKDANGLNFKQNHDVSNQGSQLLFTGEESSFNPSTYNFDPHNNEYVPLQSHDKNGFPIRKSANYLAGKNIWYDAPKSGKVVVFGFDLRTGLANIPYLSCDNRPGRKGEKGGVFACRKKNTQTIVGGSR